MEEHIARSTTCAFTGHRPAALPWGDDESDPRCQKLKEQLNQAVQQAYSEGYRHFICGMAKGADFYFCETVIALRQRYRDVTLEAAVPCLSQSARWKEADRTRYVRLLRQCDFETLIQQSYTPGCMQRRNRYMVDHASRLIAVFNGSPEGSGTLKTLHYAMEEKVRIHLIDI